MKKNIVAILILIIAVVLIGGGIFLYYNSTSSSNSKKEESVAGTNKNAGDAEEEIEEPSPSTEDETSSDNKEEKVDDTVLRQSKKEDYLGDLTNAEAKLKAEHKYNNITIKDILFQKRGNSYIFEMTLVNNSETDFYEQKTNLVFYTNLSGKIGSQSVELPIVRPKEKAEVMFKITNASFFDACDFALEKIA